ncbi:pilus assembly protein [Undibacterium sp.]|uniref:type IV pilus modification PilV family protein n=1 Tax=Undibacterium sp. TaxID=1914977 RepID=UPI00375129F9
MRNSLISLRLQSGALMLEVLVTFVILAIGLLGLAGLQVKLQSFEMESYQRAQALMLLDDMAIRITTNRNAAASYVTNSPLGAKMTCPTTTTMRAQRDIGEWCQALQGAAEKSSGASVGTLVGGRGCVESLGSDSYMVTVSWQGYVSAAAPAATITCGQNSYDQSGTPCVNDLCRRAVTTVVRIAKL